MTAPQSVSSHQIYTLLMASQSWAPEQMQAFQRARLQDLLRHAKANIPLYQMRLDGLIKNDGTFEGDAWQRLPILTRK